MADGDCTHCGDYVHPRIRNFHWLVADKHKGLCCDCFDLATGTKLEDVNRYRATKGLQPIPAMHSNASED